MTNGASVGKLRRIIHIDAVWAREIVTLRRERGFALVDDLTRVRGISPTRVRDINEQGLTCVKSPARALETGERDSKAGLVD